MGSKRRRAPVSQTIGGVLFGFEQHVLRSTPPPQELVHHARPDDPVPAADGSLITIGLPDTEPADRSAALSADPDRGAQPG
jgi:hypothetical protein